MLTNFSEAKFPRRPNRNPWGWSVTRILAILLIFVSVNVSTCNWTVPYLFEHPRDGKFKVIPWKLDRIDKTSYQHLMGSFGASVILDVVYDKTGIDDSHLWAPLTILALGFLKEVEDGFREGFSRRDLLMDLIGCAAGYGTMKGLAVMHNTKQKKIIIIYNLRF